MSMESKKTQSVEIFERMPNHAKFGHSPPPLQIIPPKNHGSVNLIRLATFAILRQKEKLSNDKAIIRPTH